MDLASVVDGVTDTAIDRLVNEYLDLYDVVPSLRPDGDRHDSLRYGAALEIGLRDFLEAGRFTAFTTTFEDLGTLRQLPGLAVQRLMADGYGFGAEGDWKTAMLVRIAAVMGGGRPGGASLMEDYTYHMVPGEELSLGAHMLEVSPSLSSQRARLDIAPLSIGGKEDPVRLVFTADAGPAIVLALSDMRDRFRLVAAEVECLPLPAEMPHLPVGHAVWRSKPDFRTAATAWLAAGASHHTAMSNQIGTRVVQDFAAMVGVELLVIDADTTIEAAERELRLNSAAFR
jgi:L-arabinose isomerase